MNSVVNWRDLIALLLVSYKCLTDEKVDDAALHGWTDGGHLHLRSVRYSTYVVNELMGAYITGERAAVGSASRAASDCVSGRAVWRVNEDAILTTGNSAARWGVAGTADLGIRRVAVVVWTVWVWNVSAVDRVAVTAIAWHITAIARVVIGTAVHIIWGACWCTAGGSAGRVWISGCGGAGGRWSEGLNQVSHVFLSCFRIYLQS